MTVCRRCHTAEARIITYWGDALCPPCAQRVAGLLDEHDAWPPVPWAEDDREVTG